MVVKITDFDFDFEIAKALLHNRGKASRQAREGYDALVSAIDPGMVIHILKSALYRIPADKGKKNVTILAEIEQDFRAQIQYEALTEMNCGWTERSVHFRRDREFQFRPDIVSRKYHVISKRFPAGMRESTACLSALVGPACPVILSAVMDVVDAAPMWFSHVDVPSRHGKVPGIKAVLKPVETWLFNSPQPVRSDIDITSGSILDVAVERMRKYRYTLDKTQVAVMKAFIVHPNVDRILKDEEERNQTLYFLERGIRDWEDNGSRYFYSKWMVDWRGRCYQLGPLSMVGHGACKAMLRGERKPLSRSGYLWMLRALANANGLDKKSWAERDAWAEEHVDDFTKLGELLIKDPESGINELIARGADEPFAVLSISIELAKLATWTGPVEKFETSILCGWDATCSGVQVISSLYRDADLMKATNIIGSDGVQDIYMELVNHMDKGLDRRKPSHKVFMKAGPVIKRKIGKAIVMKLVYGAAKSTHIKSVVEHVEGLVPEEKIRATAEEIVDLALATIEKDMGPMTQFLGWAKTMAEIFKQVGKHTTWRTPFDIPGFVPQKYTASKIKVVKPARIRYYRKGKVHKVSRCGIDINVARRSEWEIDYRAEKTASAPCIVHSIDATMLQMLVSGLSDETLGLVHDCIYMHPGATPKLLPEVRNILKVLFLENNPMENLMKQVIEKAACSNVKMNTRLSKALESFTSGATDLGKEATPELTAGIENGEYAFC